MESVFISKTVNGSPNKLSDFKPDDTVIYIYDHNWANPYLEDCLPGKVKRVGDIFVFVLFWDQDLNRYSETAQACNPRNLWHRI